ncbi:MAG: FecR domain-containing protein, partial [Verrucomicrobiaceae bacterium]
IELMEGKAAFAVAKASGAFLVRTAVGNTRVLGTEFSVELKPASKGEDQVKGGEAMKLSTVMLVVVMSGLVEVNVGGVSYSLTGGQSRAFGEDGGKPRPKREGGEGDKGDKGGRKHNVSGVIGSVDGGSVTLNMKGDGAAHSETIKITAATVISIQTDEDEMRAGEGGKEKRVPKTVVGTAGDLKVGMKATASVNSAGEAITITQMRAPKKEGEGEKKKEPKRQGGEGDRKPESKGKPGEDK